MRKHSTHGCFIRYLLLCSLAILLAANSSQAQWLKSNGPKAGRILSVAASNSRIFAAVEGDYLYRSLDNGVSWAHPPSNDIPIDITRLGIYGQDLYAWGEAALYRSSDNGVSWSSLSSGIPTTSTIDAFIMMGTTMFAGTSSGIYRSTNRKGIWTRLQKADALGESVLSFAVIGSELFAGFWGSIGRSSDNGATWVRIDKGLPLNSTISSLGVVGTNLYAKVESDNHIPESTIFRSSNRGATWTDFGLGENTVVASLVARGNTLFASSYDSIFRSPDSVVKWTPVCAGLPKNFHEIRLCANGNECFAGSFHGVVMRLTGNESSWTRLTWGMVPLSVNSFTSFGAYVFAGTTGSGVFSSIDSGQSWTQTEYEYDFPTVQDVYFSVNNGGSSYLENGIELKRAPGIFLDNSGTYFAGTRYGVIRSFNQGKTWTPSDTASIKWVSAMLKYGTEIYAATKYDVFRSSNNGDSWIKLLIGFPSRAGVRSLAAAGGYLFAATDSGIYRFSIAKKTWTLVNHGLSGVTINCLAAHNNTVFAGTDHGQVLRSADDGATWVPINAGLPTIIPDGIAPHVNALFVFNDYLLAGINFNSVYRLLLPQSTAAIPPSFKPAEFGFENSAGSIVRTGTAVAFSVQKRSMVELCVYDLRGKKVATLIKAELSPGTHHVSFPATGLARGSYLLKLSTAATCHTGRILFE